MTSAEPADPRGGAVRYELHGGVAIMTLNRPDRRNAWNLDLGRGMEQTFTELSDRPDVRAVVLTGAGSAFCSGADLAREFPRGYDGRDDLRALLRETFHPAILALRDVAKPLIAAVNGPAIGAGACLALAADMSVMAEGTFLQFRFAHIGLMPDVGATTLLAAVVGPQQAAELLMLAERVEAVRAKELRLVSRVVPDAEVLSEAVKLAQRLAAGPTLAYAATKRALRLAYQPTFAEQLETEAALQMTLTATDDWAEGRAAFLAHREPIFRGQ
jgi:2-(1,2-epoxy-1,2-dihydrophenyl)acetyl-CoA isomerase